MNICKKSLNLISSLKYPDLIKLGYGSAESIWISNLGKELSKKQNKKIFINEYNNIKKSKIETLTTNDKFYSSGFQTLGNQLMLYNFSKPNEYSKLLEYNNSNDKSNTNQLLKLLTIIENNKKIF